MVTPSSCNLLSKAMLCPCPAAPHPIASSLHTMSVCGSADAHLHTPLSGSDWHTTNLLGDRKALLLDFSSGCPMLGTPGMLGLDSESAGRLKPKTASSAALAAQATELVVCILAL